MADDFKVIKVDRFDSKAIRHAFDDVGRQTYNNRVSKVLRISKRCENPLKGSTWNEYVFSLMSHLTHVNSLFSQAK